MQRLLLVLRVLRKRHREELDLCRVCRFRDESAKHGSSWANISVGNIRVAADAINANSTIFFNVFIFFTFKININ